MTLTFLRTNELIGALWTEFDLDNALWIVPAARMKIKNQGDHVVTLTPQVLTILNELKTISGNSRYLLLGRNSNKPISNNILLSALYRLGYKSKMTGHGFRTVASTAMNESGLFNPDAIERQLAHREKIKYVPHIIEPSIYWSVKG